MHRETSTENLPSHDIVIAPEAVNYFNTANENVINYFHAKYIPVNNYLERVRQSGTFKDTEFSLTCLRDFNQLWEGCFGKNGYMNSLDDDALETAKHTIALAYVLAEYGHFTQKRKDEKPYMSHVIAVAQMVSTGKQEPGVIAAALLHDIVEDSRENKREVMLEDIEILFGAYLTQEPRDKLIKRVDALTKVRQQIKSISFSDSITKLIEAKDRAVLFIKVNDRLHNMRTLFHHKNPAKEHEIALETIGIFAPIAYFSGLTEEYHELMDLSVRTLHPALFSRIHPSLRTPFKASPQLFAYFEKMNQAMLTHVTLTEVRPSRIHEIVSILEKSDRREQLSNLFYTTVNAFITDERVQTATDMANTISGIMNMLIHEQGYSIPFDGETGYTAMHQQLRSNFALDYPVAITLMKNNSYVTFLFWKESRYQEMQVSFSRDTSIIPLTDDEKKLMTAKQQRLSLMFELTKTREGDANLPWLFGNLLQRHNFIQVSEKQKDIITKVPLSEGSTVMDLLLLGIEQWEYVKTITINGNPLENYSAELFGNDSVEVEYSQDPHVDPSWFHDIKRAAMCVDVFRQKLLEYENLLQRRGDTEALRELQTKINILGMNIVQAAIGKPVRLNVERVLQHANVTDINATTMYHDIALLQHDQKIIDRILEAFRSYQKNIRKITVTVRDVPNVLTHTLVAIDSYLNQFGIKHDRVDFVTRWDQLQNFVMDSYYDVNDPNYQKYIDAYQSMSKGGVTIEFPQERDADN